MIERVVNWFVSILIVLNIPYMIYFNVVHIFSKWKCRKKQYFKPFNACHESDCKFAGYCRHYEHVCTAEEIDMLKKLIHEMKY